MIRALALFMVVASVAASAQTKLAPMQLALPSLQTAGVDAEKNAFYAGHLAQQLSLQPDVRCMTSAEISSLLGLERQKQLLGCDSDAANSCMAELANALGVDGIVTGNIGKVGTGYQVNLRILSARDGKQLAAASSSASNEDDLLKLLNRTAPDLAAQLRASLGRPALVEQAPGLRRWAWIPAATGVAAGALGGFFLVRSENASARLRSAPGSEGRPSTEAEARTLSQQGQRDQTLARIGLGVGVAALATAAGLYLFGGPEEPNATVTVAPGGAGVAGTF